MRSTSIDAMRDWSFGERLEAAMSATRYSADDLADRLSVSRGTVQLWITNRRRPNRANLNRLADILGVTARWLESPDPAREYRISILRSNEDKKRRVWVIDLQVIVPSESDGGGR